MCRARGGRLRLGEAEVGEGLVWAQAPQPPTKVQLESLELVASSQQSGRGKPIDPGKGRRARRNPRGPFNGGSMQLGLSGRAGWGPEHMGRGVGI